MDDEVLRDDEPIDDGEASVDDLEHDVEGKKKKDLLKPEETESLEDLEDDELEDEEEPFDDVNPI